MGFLLVCATSALALAWGFAVREERLFRAESGAGYALGIAGTGCMVLLLGYSLRKRLRFLRGWGPIRSWFAAHMVLGVLGPALILFHANFRLGSTNSTVAFGCVMLVAASGFVGRLIYPKIHRGLTDQHESLAELRKRALAGRHTLSDVAGGSPDLADLLREFEAFALGSRGGLLHRVARALALGTGARSTRRCYLRLLARAQGGVPPPRARLDEAQRAFSEYVARVRRVVQFETWERLFSLWHAVHLPLCFLLFAAATLHVVAVHMY